MIVCIGLSAVKYVISVLSLLFSSSSLSNLSMVLFENLLAGYSLTHCLLIDNSQYGPDSGLLGITMNLLL